MSRAFDFVVMTVIYVIAFIIHRIAIALFAPESGLHEIASTGTEMFNGAAHMDLWFEILSIWVPMFACGGITAYVIFREYRRQSIAATTGPMP